jgi:predicted Zn-dependent peptidase
MTDDNHGRFYTQRGGVLLQFQTTSSGRLHVHVLSTEQFRTRHISVKVVHPLFAPTITASAMLPYLWMDGTMSYPSAQGIMRRADDLFGSVVRSGVSKRGNRQILEIGAAVPDEGALSNAEGLFLQVSDFVCEIFLRPLREGDSFATANVLREKALHRKRIESLFDDKIAFAMERCAELTCHGEDVGLPRLGFADQVSELTAEQLYSEYEKILQEAEVHVYIVGNVPASETVAYWQSTLQAFAEAGQARENPHESSVAPLLRGAYEPQTVVEKQAIAQGKLNLGYRTELSFADEQYPAAMMMNGVLGGFPHSKLFVNVREKANLAYYASSRLDSMTGMFAIQTGIEVEQYSQALEIILAQVKELQRGNLTSDEIEFTRRGLVNQYQQVRDQPLSLADLHFNGVLTGKHREIDATLAELEQVSQDDIVQAAGQLTLDTVYFLRSEEEVEVHG